MPSRNKITPKISLDIFEQVGESLTTTRPPTHGEILRYYNKLRVGLNRSNKCHLAQTIVEQIVDIWKNVKPNLPLRDKNSMVNSLTTFFGKVAEIRRNRSTLRMKKATAEQLKRVFNASKCNCGLPRTLCRNEECSECTDRVHINCLCENQIRESDRQYLKELLHPDGPRLDFIPGSSNIQDANNSPDEQTQTSDEIHDVQNTENVHKTGDADSSIVRMSTNDVRNTEALHVETNKKTDEHNCEYCDEVFLNKSGLSRHMPVHAKDRERKCDHCEKVFKSETLLNQHLLRVLMKKSYKCIFCDKSFAHEHTLTDHIKRLHSKKKHFACKKCNNETLEKLQFVRHACVNSQEYLNYKCDYCDEDFSLKSLLLNHVKKHYPRYKCDECKKTFYLRSNLFKHIQEHYTAKYDCNNCKKSFGSHSDFQRHFCMQKNYLAQQAEFRQLAPTDHEGEQDKKEVFPLNEITNYMVAKDIFDAGDDVKQEIDKQLIHAEDIAYSVHLNAFVDCGYIVKQEIKQGDQHVEAENEVDPLSCDFELS